MNHSDLSSAGSYLRVRIGRTQFLVTEADPAQVSRIHTGDDPGTSMPPADGTPLLLVDETLHAVAAAPVTAEYRVLLQSGIERALLACDGADPVGPDGVTLYALPPCMRTPESVFSAVATVGDNIHGVCHAGDLLAALGIPSGRNAGTRAVS